MYRKNLISNNKQKIEVAKYIYELKTKDTSKKNLLLKFEGYSLARKATISFFHSFVSKIKLQFVGQLNNFCMKN